MNADQREQVLSQSLHLAVACPYDSSNPPFCPLCGVRKLPLEERIQWVRSLSNNDLEYLSAYHQICSHWASLSGVGPSKEGLLAEIVNSSDDAIIGKSLDGIILSWNPAAEKIYGYSAGEVLGQPISLIVPPDYQAETDRIMESIMRGERVNHHETVRVRKDGERVYISLTVSPIKDATGKIIGASAIARDITEKKLAGEALHKVVDDLQKTHEELEVSQLHLINAEKMERLAAGVAHEVKNPLAILLMSVGYLSEALPDVDETVATIFDDMRGAIMRADAIIHGLLDFAASEKLELQPDDLNAVIEEALLLVIHSMIQYHVALKEEFSPKLPSVAIDRTKVGQVFVNLFTNAIDAMQGGGTLIVRTYSKQNANANRNPDCPAKELSADDYIVVVEIEDTGSGIPRDKLAKVFDPFFTTKPPGKGTGIGLTVTKKIIDLHKGTIEITNRERGGVRCVLQFHAFQPIP